MKAEIYAGKNPMGFPWVQIKKEVYNQLGHGWIRQKTGRKVSKSLQERLTSILFTYYKQTGEI